jgi:hypothetical protein
VNTLEWSRELGVAYRAKTGTRRAVRLPAAHQIEVAGGRGAVTVSMTDRGVTANMQTNSAAFEGWALALRVWCEVEHIVLTWAPQENESDPHYQRFLYRVARFHSLFPEWFKVAEPERLRSAKALGNGHLILNVASDRRPPGQATKREAELELRLLKSEAFRTNFGLEKPPDRQLPLVLFNNSVVQNNRIFTGGKSAIDLVGVGGGIFWIFELKAGKNINVGALSELLFYASVIRDAAGVCPRFQFRGGKPGQGTTVHSSDIRECARIEAVLLGEELHPLIGNSSHSAMIGYLNKAVDRHWNSSPQQVPVRFRATLLESKGMEDFKFKDLLSCTELPG